MNRWAIADTIGLSVTWHQAAGDEGEGAGRDEG